MCEHGDTVLVRLEVPADLSHTGRARMKVCEIDRCIAPLVMALRDAGIKTRGCCCGHGKGPGDIHLQDGRVLVIMDASEAFGFMENFDRAEETT